MKKGLSILLVVLGLVGCSSESSQDAGSNNRTGGPIEIGTTVPYSDILEYCKEPLKEQGVEISVREFTDYLTPNLALDDGSIDANYFQHEIYFEESKENNNLDLVSIGKFYFGPLAVYSNKVSSLDELGDNAEIIIPNDPANESRALILLDDAGIIKLADNTDTSSTADDIVENPKNFNFTSLDAATIPNALTDCDAAVINFNYALDAGLSVSQDALYVEKVNADYTNLVAVRAEDKDRKEFEILAQVLRSDQVQEWVLEEFQGNLIPVKEKDGQLIPVE